MDIDIDPLLKILKLFKYVDYLHRAWTVRPWEVVGILACLLLAEVFVRLCKACKQAHDEKRSYKRWCKEQQRQVSEQLQGEFAASDSNSGLR